MNVYISSALYFLSTLPVVDPYKIKAKINPKGPLVTHHAVSCLLSIVDRFFEDSSLIVMTDSFNMTAPGADIERIFIEEVHSLERWSVMVVGSDERSDSKPKNKNETMSYVFADRADYYVVIVDSLKMFDKKIINLVELDSWNPRANIVVLCSTRLADENALKTYSSAMLKRLWSHYVLYAVVLLQDVKVKTTFHVFSWNPYYPPERCGVSNATNVSQIYDTCIGGHLKRNVGLFNNKLPSNMHGCPLKVLAVVMPPFINKKSYTNPGIEIELLDTIARKLNLMVVIDLNNTVRGERISYGYWTGMIGRLMNSEGDLAFGGIYPDNAIHDEFDATVSYLQDSYTWVVPRALPLPRWLGLMIIFDGELWMSVGIVYVMCTIVWMLIGNLSNESKQHKALDHCAINTWMMNIGGVAYSRPVNQALRTFFIFLCIYNVVLVTAYQTKLITVLTQPYYEKQIDSLKEILDSGLNVGGSAELQDIIKQAEEKLYYDVDKKYQVVINSEEALSDVITNRKLSLLASRMFLNELVSKKREFTDRYGNPNYHELTSNVLSIPVEIIARKGYPHVEMIGELISLTKSNGLMSKWVRDYAIESKRKSAEVRRNATLLEDETGDIRLSLEHLEGGFCILAVGYVAGVIAFVLELGTRTRAYRCAKNKLASAAWGRLWERVIDSWKSVKCGKIHGSS